MVVDFYVDVGISRCFLLAVSNRFLLCYSVWHPVSVTGSDMVLPFGLRVFLVFMVFQDCPSLSESSVVLSLETEVKSW